MAEREQARLAFVGCGGFATASILPCIHQIPEIDLVAVCDVVQARADKAARNFGARKAYTDSDLMLDREELDGVFCIGPAPQQYELAPHVLRRGLPVYVEKPSANTSAEAGEMAELADANGVFGQCGFMKRFSVAYRVAKEILAKDTFGPLRLLTIRFGQGAYPRIWGIDSYHRAFLIGQCVHLMDLARHFGGHVSEVSALFNEGGTDRCAYLANVKFAGGAIGQLNLNCYTSEQAFRDIQERCELYGTNQSVFVDNMRNVRYLPPEDLTTAVPGGGPFPVSLEPSWSNTIEGRAMYGYLHEVRHFALRCIGKVEGGPDLWDSFEALRLGEAIYTSAHEGKPVSIPARA
jgi:predicted dehydrogenase